MNNESSANSGFKDGGGGAVITPQLSGGLVVALVAFLVFAGILVILLNRFDDAKRQAQEAEARTTKQRTELSTLRVEVECLTKRKDVLAPTVADWDKRLKEMHDAQATADSLNAKQRRTESDIAQAGNRLEDANRALLDVDKQKAELTLSVERLKSELVTIKKVHTDARPCGA